MGQKYRISMGGPQKLNERERASSQRMEKACRSRKNRYTPSQMVLSLVCVILGLSLSLWCGLVCLVLQSSSQSSKCSMLPQLFTPDSHSRESEIQTREREKMHCIHYPLLRL